MVVDDVSGKKASRKTRHPPESHVSTLSISPCDCLSPLKTRLTIEAMSSLLLDR